MRHASLGISWHCSRRSYDIASLYLLSLLNPLDLTSLRPSRLSQQHTAFPDGKYSKLADGLESWFPKSCGSDSATRIIRIKSNLALPRFGEINYDQLPFQFIFLLTNWRSKFAYWMACEVLGDTGLVLYKNLDMDRKGTQRTHKDAMCRRQNVWVRSITSAFGLLKFHGSLSAPANNGTSRRRFWLPKSSRKHLLQTWVRAQRKSFIHEFTLWFTASTQGFLLGSQESYMRIDFTEILTSSILIAIKC